jgi:hypothetical protein
MSMAHASVGHVRFAAYIVIFGLSEISVVSSIRWVGVGAATAKRARATEALRRLRPRLAGRPQLRHRRSNRAAEALRRLRPRLAGRPQLRHRRSNRAAARPRPFAPSSRAAARPRSAAPRAGAARPRRLPSRLAANIPLAKRWTQAKLWQPICNDTTRRRCSVARAAHFCAARPGSQKNVPGHILGRASN